MLSSVIRNCEAIAAQVNGRDCGRREGAGRGSVGCGPSDVASFAEAV